MPNDTEDFFEQQQESSDRSRFYLVMENVRNTMRAVKIMVQEGEYDEAIEAINEALGETEG